MRSSCVPIRGVTVPKESVPENSAMEHDPRPHIRRRGHAIDRLRSITTGAAIAGLAGTAGFGLLAARSWSGNPNALNAAGGATTEDVGGTNGTSGTPDTNGASGTSGTNRTKTVPNTGRAQQPTTTVPRVQRGTGSGHASTGGSN
jgi:hypothetical protein